MCGIFSTFAGYGFQASFAIQAHGRPAAGHRPAGARHHCRSRRPDAARRDGFGQDLHHGQRDRARAEAHAHPQPQQDAGRTALRRVQAVLPRELRAVLRQLLRLLPAGGLHPLGRQIHRKRPRHQRGTRPPAPGHHLGPAQRPPRRGGGVERVVYIWYG